MKISSLLSSSPDWFWDPTSPLINTGGVNFSPGEGGVKRPGHEAEQPVFGAEIKNDWGSNSIQLM